MPPGILGAEVDDARYDSSRYLTAKPSHVGVNVNGLAYPLHQHMVCSFQMKGYGLMLGVVLSYRCSGWWRFSEDVKQPGRRYLMDN
jgi:preprotein translocase subunit Sec63